MESQTLCAYNQTRECFLALEVSAVDLAGSNIEQLMRDLALKCGEGLWIKPFRGILAAWIPAPLDLICLDENCNVIEIVESFPTFRVSAPSHRAASVLALPIHSIYSSQTQAGDQLVVCISKEIETHLEQFTTLQCGTGDVARVPSLKQTSVLKGDSCVALLDAAPIKPVETAQPKFENPIVAPAKNYFVIAKNWLQRWWSPDPRRTQREPTPGLAAYFWSGAAPKAHQVRDMSPSGLYLVTSERWYLGTVILMTLQRTDCDDKSEPRSISLYTRAVRWGDDGVGLQFVLPESSDSKLGSLVNAADRQEIDLFVNALTGTKPK
jgi:uncharacterized membrane protein (UPF0127 family)